MMKYIYLLILTTLTINSFAQDKEILIIGTMHTVPKLVKNSYKPLLKYSKKYSPNAIYVECVPPDDTVSLNYDSKEFVIQSDSFKNLFTLDNERFTSLNNTDLDKFTEADFDFMSKTYFVKKDYANYSYFKYLKAYGMDGSKEPLRHENADLTAKLAISLNLKYIHSMDYQQNRQEYHTAWSECVKAGKENSDNDINKEIGKKQYMSAVVPALFGRFGKHTNQLKSLNRLHLLNSFRYVQNSTSSCENATKHWDERNFNMSNNIAKQVKEQSYLKNIVIVGAGHVIGIKEALEKNHPELKVKIMYQ